MPVVPYYLGRPAQAWIAAMSGPARAATENSCAATSLATATFPASPRPAVPTVQRKTQEEASPRSHGRNRQRLGGPSRAGEFLREPGSSRGEALQGCLCWRSPRGFSTRAAMDSGIANE